MSADKDCALVSPYTAGVSFAGSAGVTGLASCPLTYSVSPAQTAVAIGDALSLYVFDLNTLRILQSARETRNGKQRRRHRNRSHPEHEYFSTDIANDNP